MSLINIKSMKILKAFSLIELSISFITIAILLAAFSPVISKKFASSATSSSGGSSGGVTYKCSTLFPDSDGACMLCTKNPKKCIMCSKTCPSGEYKNVFECKCESCSTKHSDSHCVSCDENSCFGCSEGYSLDSNNKCMPCSDVYANCLSCDSSGCSACSSGYKLVDGKCEFDGPCPPKTLEISINGVNYCVTQYNMGDQPEFPVNVEGVTVVASDKPCVYNSVCFQGLTAFKGYCNSDNGDYSGCYRTTCT